MVALAETAQEMIQKTSFLRPLGLKVVAEGKSLVIIGKAASYHQKQVAQETIRPLLKDGIRMENRIEVK